MNRKTYVGPLVITDIMKELVLSAVIRKFGKRYSSWCPELDIATEGDSVKEAKTNLKEAVQCHVEVMIENGDTDLLLEKLGLTMKDIKKQTITSRVITDKFEIPLSL